ncbi:hypothetical protein LTR12_017883 [Friedmanniomyces endolithicus]|nr:hypothetical protein LTR12_017883 [Friedmanniomyces endolithicus]
MENPRSVMLTVIPANVDIATQEIIDFAAELDPAGDRTLGVLTKPDLVDPGTEPRVVDLIEGRTRPMKLGWHVVRNPGQQQISDPSINRHELELNFFRTKSPWNDIAEDQVGIKSLRSRLKDVLSSLVRREFPRVKQEIEKKLKAAQMSLGDMGPERSSPHLQGMYLTDLASRFQRLVSLSLDAKYGADRAFDKDPSLRMAPAIAARFTSFSDDIGQYGQEFAFSSPEDPGLILEPTLVGDPQEQATAIQIIEPKIDVRKLHDAPLEIDDLLHPSEQLSSSSSEHIETWLRQVYDTSRGFELGTFGGHILATTMKRQSSKWTSISLGYISDVVVLLHRFISAAFSAVCHDADVMSALVNAMTEKLTQRYRTALDQVRFILEVERGGMPLTMNHYFSEHLDECRQKRMLEAMSNVSFSDCKHGTVVRLQDVVQTHPMSNADHIVKDIHDILRAYYEVTLERFKDNVLKQATDYFLLSGPDTPLNLFSPTFVSALTPDEVEHIAGEAPKVKRRRAQLGREIRSLSEAKAILIRG